SGTFDATPLIQSVISASNYGGFPALAPGTWMEIYGQNLANVIGQTWSGADFKGNAAPIGLAGTSVTIGGQPAYIYYVSQGQINAQVPSNIAPGPQPVVVTTPGGTSSASTVTVNVTEPGLLSPAVFKLSAGQYVTALFPDGVTFVLPPGSINGVTSTRARPGDTIVLYGVGFGTVTPDSPAGQIVTQSNRLSANFQASIGATPATVTYSGLTGGYLGLYQFNVVVPNVPAGDAVPFTFTLGGAAGTQKLIIAIGN
ncbi:MAG: IPT/TIG domain-containing protein, partial [Acidobacteria bacterium]|nr:IPT/TIG domain-containing protein [Acidobacteriota bacterium]